MAEPTEDEAAVAAAYPGLAEAIARYREEVRRVTAGRPLRAGRSNPESVYADTSPDWREHLYLGTLRTPALAAGAIADHNTMLDLRWLFGKGYGVRVTPDPEFFPGGTDGQMWYEVILYDLEGEHVLTAGSRPTLGAALAEARRQAEEATP